MIDRQTADKIKETADIVEVVSDYVKLVRRGAGFMGLCPFHNERTPSFSVNPRRNFCYCFSCHKGGSPVNFIMEKEGISYHDALLQLAKKYGITVEEKELTEEELRARSEREAMLVANEWAMNEMERNLRDTDEGRDIGLQYFYSRGLTEEAIRQFHLGYALDAFASLTNAAQKAGFDINVLKSVGLTGTSAQGSDYDRFRGRVIFPVFNSSGKVIAFGGRDLKGKMAKYVNSPESEIYRKSNELYGIYQARPAIVREDKCYLVEGYMDVIGMWQSGMKNVVSSSGTSLTDGQIALIHRFTKNVTLIYDGDAAGIKASLRGMDMLLTHRLNVRVLLLPDGDDPDSFSRKHTPEEFRQYVKDNETDIIRFKTKVLMSQLDDDPMKRVEVIKSVVASVACIVDKVERDVYVQECSRILGVPEDSVMMAVAKARGEVVEKLRQERTRKAFPDTRQNQIVMADGTIHETAADSDGNRREIEEVRRQGVLATHPLMPLERKVVEYCLKYGYMDFCDPVEENNDSDTQDKANADLSDNVLTVVEYVDAEMKDDNMFFTVDEFRKLFDELLSMLPAFRLALSDFNVELDRVCARRREEGIEAIAAKGGSVSEMQADEEMLDDEIRRFAEEKRSDFARDYPSRRLASHESDDIRRLVTSLISQRHTLSQRFLRQSSSFREEDSLIVRIPRAIVEWKVEILDLKIKEILEKLSSGDTGSEEDERCLQASLNSLVRIRADVARDAGERIIAPHR